MSTLDFQVLEPLRARKNANIAWLVNAGLSWLALWVASGMTWSTACVSCLVRHGVSRRYSPRRGGYHTPGNKR